MDIISNKFSIVFDLDGTLIDISERDYYVYKTIILKYNGIPLPFNEYWQLRRERKNIFDILNMSSLNSFYHDSFLELRNKLLESEDCLAIDKLIPSVFDTLMQLKNEYNLFLVTIRKNIKTTLSQLDRFDLKSIFNDCIFIVSDNKLKTFLKINNLLVVVGDTENDIRPAKAVGALSIGITTGIRNKNLLIQENPNFIIDDLKDVIRILKIIDNGNL